jgi:hypothetical protein
MLSSESCAVLIDKLLQRHRRAAADRLDHVVGASEDAGLVVGRHLAEVLQDERLLEFAPLQLLLAPSRTLGRFAPPAQQAKGLQPVSYLRLFRAGYFTKAVSDSR